jgi:hypothetical protein
MAFPEDRGKVEGQAPGIGISVTNVSVGSKGWNE